MALSSSMVLASVRTTPFTCGSQASVTSMTLTGRGGVSDALSARAAAGAWASVLTSVLTGALHHEGPWCARGMADLLLADLPLTCSCAHVRASSGHAISDRDNDAALARLG